MMFWKVIDSYVLLEFRVGFDFYQHRRINQSLYFNHRRGRHDIAKGLAVRAAIFFPARNVSHKHARPHDVPELCAQSLQSSFDIPQTLLRLLVCVIASNNLAIVTEHAEHIALYVWGPPGKPGEVVIARTR